MGGVPGVPLSRAFFFTVVIASVAGCTPRASLPVGRTSASWPPPVPPVVSPVTATTESDWAMFRDDAERTGFAEGSAIGAQVHTLWRVAEWNKTDYGAAKGSPAIAGGVLYCGTDTGKFAAVRAGDGHLLWSVQIPDTTEGIHASPAVAGDLVYIATYNGGLYALDRQTGATAWSFRRGYQAGASPAVVPAWGIVYSAHERDPAGGGILVALDAQSGKLRWQADIDGHPHSSVAVDERLGRVFLGDNRGEVHAFDAFDGRPKWTTNLRERDLDAKVKGTVTVVRRHGLVLASAWSGKVYALREADGHLAWERVVGGGGRLMASPAYDPVNDAIYIGSPNGILVALGAADGRVLWQRSLGGAIYSSASISGDARRLVVGAGWDVVAVDTRDGSIAWRQRLDGLVSGSPSLLGGQAYVTTRRGSLWALQT